MAGTWSELATKIKTTYAQLYYLDQNERLTREILDLMTEKELRVRLPMEELELLLED